LTWNHGLIYKLKQQDILFLSST